MKPALNARKTVMGKMKGNSTPVPNPSTMPSNPGPVQNAKKSAPVTSTKDQTAVMIAKKMKPIRA